MNHFNDVLPLGPEEINGMEAARRCNAYPKLVDRIRNNLLAHALTGNDGEVRCTCQQCGASRALLCELGEYA